MSKRNKKRYQRTEKPRRLILLTGRVYLQYLNDDEIAAAGKGDLLVYPENESLHTTRQGDYGATGFSGYFKVDVSDGRQWCAVRLNEIFPQREHHFGKSECPIDRYELIAQMLRGLSGRTLLSTYRDHYALEEE